MNESHWPGPGPWRERGAARVAVGCRSPASSPPYHGLCGRAGAHLSAAFASSWSGKGIRRAMIGLSAAMTPIGFICCAPFVPAVTPAASGPRRRCWSSAFTRAAILALIGLDAGHRPVVSAALPARRRGPAALHRERGLDHRARAGAIRGRVLGHLHLGHLGRLRDRAVHADRGRHGRLRRPSLVGVCAFVGLRPAACSSIPPPAAGHGPWRARRRSVRALPAARAGAALRRLRDRRARAGEPVAPAGLRPQPRHRRGARCRRCSAC